MSEPRPPAHARSRGSASRRVASSRSGSGSGGGARPSGKPPARVYRRRRIIVGLLAALLAFLIWLTFSLGTALTDPSLGSSLMPRFAEWGRSHGIGFAVNWFEKEWYALNPPKKGGKPPAGSFTAKGSKDKASTSTCPDALPAPKPMSTPAQPSQPNEGVWQPVARLVANCAAVYVTYVRPNSVNTSFVVGLAWMDPKLVSATLYSGSQIPGGGPFKFTAPINSTESQTLVAAFNAGFRMGDSLGGYYTQGKTVVPLVDGRASAVVYKDGTMNVAAWNRGVSMTPDVVSVRQNLSLLVQHGQPVAGLNANDTSQWGATLGGTALVWRSGLGVTANGAIVYVGGPAMSITDLADLLARAGCVRGMELDINTDWVNYAYFSPAPGQPATPANGTLLLSGMTGGTSRYFQTWWARDFYTMSARYPANSSETTTSTTGPTTTTTRRN